MSVNLDISVIICTYNRAESLKETLTCLAGADRKELATEIIVVDNSGCENTRQVVESFKERMAIRYLLEPCRGKSQAMNKALDEGKLGEIVVFLDDDMSPHPDWFQGVWAICERWPDHDIFTGRSYVVWPFDDIPGWAKSDRIESWAFSVVDYGKNDAPNLTGQFPSGNHFWIRSRVLSDGRRFDDMWAPEAKFCLQIGEDGYKYVAGPDAVAGHRVQPELISEMTNRKRAVMAGQLFGKLRLRAFTICKQSLMLKKHPILTRIYCVAKLLAWVFLYSTANLRFSYQSRIECKIVAIHRISYFFQILKIARQVEKERAEFERSSYC